MKKLLFAATIILMSAALCAQGWIQRADIQGDITDVAVASWNGNSGHIYVATNGSGVYYSTDGVCWVEKNNGLDDLQITAIANFPGNNEYVKCTTLSGKVFVTDNYGDLWVEDGSGLGNLTNSYVPTDIAIEWGITNWYTYVSTLGAGVLRQAGWGWPYFPHNTLGGTGGQINLDILSIAAAYDSSTDGHKVVAGSRTRLDDAQHPSLLYVMPDVQDGDWYVASGTPSGVSFPSVAYNEVGFAIAGLSVDFNGQGHGVYGSLDLDSTPTWGQICNFPPNQGYLAVDYFYDTDSSRYRISAGTRFGLWWVDDPWNCNIFGYTPFSGFRGNISAIGLGDANSGWAGGPGKGPIRFNPSSTSGAITNVRCNLKDYSVIDISPSPNFNNGDKTIYTASGIGGVYKNKNDINCENGDNGYFYRMIGDPDSWGTVPVLKVKPQLNYDETGCYGSQTIYAATFGKGVMRSDDGGRSWKYKNNVQSNANGLENDVITDIALHPTNDWLIWAAVYGKGVYYSGNRGDTWQPWGAIANPRVLSLAISPNYGVDSFLYAGVRSINLGGQDVGLYKYSDATWLPLSDTTAMSVRRVVLSPDFANDNFIVIGLEEISGVTSGIWLSDDQGDTFADISLSFPSPTHVYDLKMSPGFINDRLLLATVRFSSGGGGIFYASEHFGWTWNDINGGDIPPDNRVLSAAFEPNFNLQGEIFAGHGTQGLFTAHLDLNAGMDCSWIAASGFFNVPPDVRGLAVSPDDPDLLFAATANDGVFISRDGGDSFRPWSKGLTYNGSSECPVPTTLSVAVTETVSGNTYLDEDFSSGIPGSWTIINGGMTPLGGPGLTWRIDDGTFCDDRTIDDYYPDLFTDPYAIVDSDCELGGTTQDEWLITPYLDTSSAQKLVVSFNHQYYNYSTPNEHGYVKVCSSATGGNCGDDVGDWVTVMDFNNADYTERRTIDLTEYGGTGFRVAFHYTDASYDWYWAIDNVFIGELEPRVVVGTLGHGIYYAGYSDTTYYGTFYPTNVTTGSVTELRYSSLAEDIRAAHVQNGDLHSADFGSTWNQVPGIPAGVGMSDIAYGDGFKRSLSGFTWGCSSGKQVAPARATGDCNFNGSAWYYNPSPEIWTQCGTTGLDMCEEFRAILELNSDAILMGSIGVGNGAPDIYTEGIYRSADNCSTWGVFNEGLPTFPGGENAGRVTALHQNNDPTDRFILAAVNDSYFSDGTDDGGVYYSDPSSDGRAWVKTDLPAVQPGSYELTSSSGGTTVYTGLTGDGVWSSLPSTIGVSTPAAYFECANDACEACINVSTSFSNYSAGKVVTHYWTFGDGGSSSSENPSYSYGSTGAKTVTLTVDNNCCTSPDDEDSFNRIITVQDEMDFNGTSYKLSVTKIDASTVTLTWNDLGQGETGYQVWASNSASSGSPYGSPLGADATTTTVTGYIYHRIQPLSSTHICGNGEVGGSW